LAASNLIHFKLYNCEMSEREPLLGSKNDRNAYSSTDDSSVGKSLGPCQLKMEISPNEKDAIRRLSYAMCFAFFFMAVEMIGGYLANSIAIYSDAAHLLSDVAAYLISIYAIYASGKPATTDYSWGYKRSEIVGAIASVLMIWAITGWLIMQAIERFFNPPDVNGGLMLIIATLGVIVNGTMGIILARSGHGHSHSGGGHGHSFRPQEDHGHSHAKSVNHGHSQAKSVNHGHAHGKSEDHGHSHAKSEDHGHSHAKPDNHGHSHAKPDTHGHSHATPDHGHGHGHSEDHGHSHAKPDNHGHSHATADHGHGHGCDDSKGHSHANPDSSGHSHAKSDDHGHSHAKVEDHGHSHAKPNHGHSHAISENHGHSHASNDHGRSHAKRHSHSHSSCCGHDEESPMHSCDEDSHGHGHGHEQEENLNLRAAYLHVLGDLLQSMGVVIAGFLIWLDPERWWWMDPVCTLIFAVIVVYTTINIMRDVFEVLMMAVPRHVDIIKMTEAIYECDSNISQVHCCHVWALSPNIIAMTCTIDIKRVGSPPASDFSRVKNERICQETLLLKVKSVVSRFGIHHSSIEIRNPMHCIDSPDGIPHNCVRSNPDVLANI